MKVKFSCSLSSAIVTFYVQSSPSSVFPVSFTAVSLLFPANNEVMLLSLLTSPWMTWLSQLGPDCSLFQWLSHVSRRKGFHWKSIEIFLLKLPDLVITLLILSCAPEVMIFVFYPQLMPDTKSGWAGRREKFSDTVVSNSQLHPLSCVRRTALLFSRTYAFLAWCSARVYRLGSLFFSCLGVSPRG